MPNDTIPAQGATPVRSSANAGASRAARAASVSTQLPAEPPSPCFRCHQKIYQSFFFDGFGQSLDDDNPSNIARLYKAHMESDNSTGIYRTYHAGMGRDLPNQTVGTLKKAASDSGAAADVWTELLDRHPLADYAAERQQAMTAAVDAQPEAG
jgi:hypothetical protein